MRRPAYFNWETQLKDTFAHFWPRLWELVQKGWQNELFMILETDPIINTISKTLLLYCSSLQPDKINLEELLIDWFK